MSTFRGGRHSVPRVWRYCTVIIKHERLTRVCDKDAQPFNLVKFGWHLILNSFFSFFFLFFFGFFSFFSFFFDFFALCCFHEGRGEKTGLPTFIRHAW